MRFRTLLFTGLAIAAAIAVIGGITLSRLDVSTYFKDTIIDKGAQATGRSGVDKRIDVLAMAIQKGATVYDLEEAELCYAPQYGSAKDPVNMAGFVAANILRGDVAVGHWSDWKEQRAADQTPVTLDVRPAVAVAARVGRGALDLCEGQGGKWVHG